MIVKMKIQEILYAPKAPLSLYERWMKLGVVPGNIDREIVEIMHRTHMGADHNFKNIVFRSAWMLIEKCFLG